MMTDSRERKFPSSSAVAALLIGVATGLAVAAAAGAQAVQVAAKPGEKPAHTDRRRSAVAKAAGQLLTVNAKVLMLPAGRAARSLDQFRPGDMIEVGPDSAATLVIYETAQRFRLIDTTVEVTTHGLKRVKGKDPASLRPLSKSLTQIVPAFVSERFSPNAAVSIVRDPPLSRGVKLPFASHPGKLRCLGPVGSIAAAPLLTEGNTGQPATGVASDAVIPLRWVAPSGFAPIITVLDDEEKVVLREVLATDLTRFDLPLARLTPGRRYYWTVEGALPTDSQTPTEAKATAWLRLLTPRESDEAASLLREAHVLEREDDADPTPDLALAGIYTKYGLLSDAAAACQAALKRRPDDEAIQSGLKDLQARLNPR